MKSFVAMGVLLIILCLVATPDQSSRAGPQAQEKIYYVSIQAAYG
jgi:hypothetical protein